jgi:fermentation-respiration switch protein FrsA (DUF1100 family)
MFDFLSLFKTNKFKSMFLTIIGCYLLLVIIIYIFQRSLQYFPYGSASTPKGFESIKISSEDNVELLVWQKIPKNYKKIIVYFHGNAGNIGDRSYRFESFVENGYGVIALSYRGYFGSQGKPSEAGFLSDAKALLKFIKSQNYRKSDLILFGESIGSGVVAKISQNKIDFKTNRLVSDNEKLHNKNEQIADSISSTREEKDDQKLAKNNSQEDDFSLIVLDSPYYSIQEIAQRNYPFLPVKFMLKDRFSSFIYAPYITAPVLIFHGDHDFIVPITSGQKLFNIITAKKKFIEMRGASHVDTNPEFIIQQIEEFI